jgi:hypothetical protein
MIVSKNPKFPKVKASPASKSAVPDVSISRDRIRDRAFQIYESRGGQPGYDAQDWLRAEIEIASR